MQPPLDKTVARFRTPQIVFQQRQRTYHTDERLDNNEENGGNMRKPKSAVAYKVQSHPRTDPDDRQAADDKKYENEMNDEDDIG
jgi:hypothetical protein